PVHHEHGHRTGLLLVGGHSVQQRHVPELLGLGARCPHCHVQHLPGGVRGGECERVEDRLLPGPATGFGHDRGDHVHQLCQGGCVHPVGVPQQRDEQVAHHHGVGHVVLVLQQHRGHRPVLAGGRGGLGAVLVPHVPL